MLAILTDKKGRAIERLKDIPITLTNEHEAAHYWRFPVAPTRLCSAYDVAEIKISDYVLDSGIIIRVLVFTDREQHQAILDYMAKQK